MEISETILYNKQSHGSDVELIDGDWRDHWELIILIRKDGKFLVEIEGNQIGLSSINLTCGYPLVRWIDRNRFLIADARNLNNTNNIMIFNRNGAILSSFNGGDGIADIAVSKEGIWISYFDEGVFGSGISTEGLVLFSIKGHPELKYHSDLSAGPDITDCYGVCEGNSASLWLFPYMNFPLIKVNPTTRAIESYKTPKILHGSGALCVRGKFAYFHNGYDFKDELYCWEIGKNHTQRVGIMKGRTRGLNSKETNHFLSIDDQYIKLYEVINPKEYA
ncbi:MAG: TetR family transcriptional regulator [Bacillota bacterium]